MGINSSREEGVLCTCLYFFFLFEEMKEIEIPFLIFFHSLLLSLSPFFFNPFSSLSHLSLFLDNGEEYYRGRTLGKGSYGHVFALTNKDQTKFYALKTCNKACL